ncbi:MAG: hypothetical protein C4305_01090 [Thermoleophilia bacterium]
MRAATYLSLRLGEILVERGLIDHYQLECLLTEQRLVGLPLGELVVARGLVRPDELAAALAAQADAGGGRSSPSRPARSRPLLGRILVENGWLTESGLQRALLEQRRRGGLLGEILVRRRYITRAQLASALDEQRRLLSEERRSQGGRVSIAIH